MNASPSSSQACVATIQFIVVDKIKLLYEICKLQAISIINIYFTNLCMCIKCV